MSKYVDEIILDLRYNPESFKDFAGGGVIKNNIIVDGYGNTPLLSIINVRINMSYIPCSYWDKFRLERAITKWYRNISLEYLKKK